MRAAIYSRKSVKSETGDSIENQAALCRQYIEQHWPQAEIEVYEDEGFSGATLHRPAPKPYTGCGRFQTRRRPSRKRLPPLQTRAAPRPRKWHWRKGA